MAILVETAPMRSRLALLALLLLAALAVPAAANITIPGSNNGTDGALNVTSSDLVIDLSKAVTGAWDQAGTGVGVYDSTKWAVVFKYSSINIAAGRTVTFINHPSNAPVVWLVQGVATIAGTVSLDGEGSNASNRETLPGPGGFPGGRSAFSGSPATAGQGPGGGAATVAGYKDGIGVYSNLPSGASGAGTIYGNSRILPLIGGSGGGGSSSFSGSGSAGGGAVLMAVGQKLDLTGLIRANSGAFIYGDNNNMSAPGSGGAIRCVADTIAGNGALNAYGGYYANWYNVGNDGRIRLEANVFTLSTQSAPGYTLLQPLGAEGPVIWPPSPEPTLRIATINGQPATGDPHMDAQALVSGDLVISRASLVPVTIAATNVPTNATVTVRVVMGVDPDYTTPAVFQSGDATSSIWLATLVALSPQRVSAIQAKAVLP